MAYEFGTLRIDSDSRAVYLNGVDILLSRREFDVLHVLVASADKPVDSKTLREVAWAGTYVEDSNVRQQIGALRKKLGNDVIVTVPNRGYRFCSEVFEPPPATAVSSESAPTPPPSTPIRWWRLIAAGTLAILGALSWQYWPNEAVVVEYRQITRDGRYKSPTVVSDGKRIYFSELTGERENIFSAPLTSGTAVPLPIPPARLYSLSKSGKLLGRREDTGRLIEFDPNTMVVREIRNLSGAPGVAAAQPHGTHIACLSSDGLTVFDPTSVVPILQLRLPGSADWPVWDNRGQRLRFSVADPKSATTRWFELTGTDRVARERPRFSPFPVETYGAWSDDGRFFAFLVQRTNASQIWVADGDSHAYPLTTDARNWSAPAFVPGTHMIVATAGPAQGKLAALSGQPSSAPAVLPFPAYELDYSRDRQWIAYSLYPEQTIWRCRFDGSDARQLTPAGIEAHQPHWSPNGTHIAFMGRHASPGAPWHVFIVPSPGGSIDEPLPTDDAQGVPTWSPDGKKLVFGDQRLPAGFEKAAIHELDLRTREVITVDTGMWSPRLSPDGKWMLAVSYDNRSLYLRDNSRKTWTRCTSMDWIGEPIWNMDSTWIQFAGATTAPKTRMLYRISTSCAAPRPVADLTLYEMLGGEWYGITPDGSAIALQRIPDEIYAIDWRLRKHLP